MKLLKAILFFAAVTFFAACNTTPEKFKPTVTLDNAWLDSVEKQHGDTFYRKPYRRPDFVTATSYISRKDSSELQVMRDSLAHVRQVVIVKKGVRNYFAQYFANGQLMAELKFGSFGEMTGPAKYYFENGKVQSEGSFINGLRTGGWKEYDEKGTVKVLKYDSNGQQVN